jgi:hypothetical protein
LTAVAEHGQTPIGLGSVDADVTLLGGRPAALHGLGDDQADRHEVLAVLRPRLDARELQEVFDDAAHAMSLGVHALVESVGDVRIVLVEQRLRKQRQRSHGRLELVADVRDEVRARCFEAMLLGDVLDHRQCTGLRPWHR